MRTENAFRAHSEPVGEAPKAVVADDVSLHGDRGLVDLVDLGGPVLT